MMPRVGRIGAVATLGAGGAVLWAYGVTVLQPMAEAAGYAENNSYWPRDVRWPVVLGVTTLLVALSRGDRRGWTAALGFGAVWIGADLALDRVGATAWAPVAIVAALLVTAAAAGIGWTARPAAGGRRLVLTVAAMCAATAPIAAMIESPTDAEPQLPWSRALAAVLLVVAAIGATLTTAPRPGLVLLVGAAGVAAVLVAPAREVTGVLAGAGLLVAVWLLSRPWPGWTTAVGVTVAAALAYPLLVLVGVYVQFAVPIGAWFTALAGNPAIHSADSDILHVALGMGIGLIFAGASLVIASLRPTPELSGS